MNSKKLLTVGLGAVLALGAVACNDGLTDVNRNPNNPEDAPAPTLFVHATRVATSRWLGNANLRMFELLSQHLAEVQYPDTDTYRRLTSSFTEANFQQAYYTELQDFNKVIIKGTAEAAPGYYGPAMVMKSWEFGILTDLWGDVPYFGALRGDSVGLEGGLQPAYDAQKDIYTDIFKTLADANAALSSTAGPSLGTSDPIYRGDREAWRRFANSLRARHALRLVNVDPATANAQLTAAFTAPGGVFTDTAHMAVFRWPGNGVYNNPWQVNFQTRDDHRISTRLMTFLEGFVDEGKADSIQGPWDDPRLPVYAQRPDSMHEVGGGRRLSQPGEYVGLDNGQTAAAATSEQFFTSKTGTRTYAAAFPSYLMTLAEVRFIQAEAAERSLGGLNPAAAAAHYEAGIRASMAQWGVTNAAAIDAYLGRPEVAYKGGVEGLKQIAIQKWIALYTDGIQAYSEWRRTCQPANVRPGPDATQDDVPRRLQYSQNEKAVNAASVDAAIARQGPDAFTTRIYWDKSPEAAPTHVIGCGRR